MSIPKAPTLVRNCWGSKTVCLEIDGNDLTAVSQSDQFAALAKWLRDNGTATIEAVNIEHRDDSSTYLVAYASSLGDPIPDDDFVYGG